MKSAFVPRRKKEITFCPSDMPLVSVRELTSDGQLTFGCQATQKCREIVEGRSREVNPGCLGQLWSCWTSCGLHAINSP